MHWRTAGAAVIGSLLLAACASTPALLPPATTTSTPVVSSPQSSAIAPSTATPTTAPATAAPTSADDAVSLAERLCTTAAIASSGEVASNAIEEASGVAYSPANGFIWTHNDSGDSARVFAVGLDGSDLGEFALPGIGTDDPEDIALGPGPNASSNYVYLADTGDNDAERDVIAVHRFVEPAPGEQVGAVDTFILTYPDRRHDAESFLVDPITGAWYLITKAREGGPARVFTVPAPQDPDEPLVLAEVATVDLAANGGLATGADVTVDGSVVGIRTYTGVVLFPRSPGEPLESAFANQRCLAPSLLERQGEALAFVSNQVTGTRGYVTLSEGDNPPVNVFLLPE